MSRIAIIGHVRLYADYLCPSKIAADGRIQRRNSDHATVAMTGHAAIGQRRIGLRWRAADGGQPTAEHPTMGAPRSIVMTEEK